MGLLAGPLHADLLDSASKPDPTAPLGRKLDNFKLRDYRGAERSLDDLATGKLLVIAFTGTECPVAKLYGPRLASLAKEFEPKGVRFVSVNANQQDSISAIDQYAKLHGIAFPILKDVGNVVADRLGAQRTPEVFVLDEQRIVRYWGRIDDQYGIGYTRPKPTRRDLAVALEELLAGKPVSQPITEAPGCFIGRVQPPAKQGAVTYAKDIAPILQNHCLECHRPGQIAPFALTSYDEVVGWTDTIEEVIKQGRMPPWHADPRYGQFANDCRLSDKEKQLILDWIEHGAPKGNLKDLPKPVEFAEGWRIPKPDTVVKIPRPIHVPATGTIEYEFVAVDPGFKEDRWVKAAEVRPGCPSVVHHILVFVQPPGGGNMGKHRGFITNWLAATVPGARPQVMPEGTGKFIPAGSRLLFQIHYTPNGSPQVDQSYIGLVFADPKTIKKEVSTEMAVNPKFEIPPHDPNYRVDADTTLEEDTVLLNMTPHTHLRGKAFKFEAIYPTGEQEVLLDVPRYDFNWQNTYILTKPKVLPKGTRIHCVAFYDNSKNNRSNPNPEAKVRWGDQTWDEMMIGYYDMVPVNQDLIKNPKITQFVRKELPPLDRELKKLAEGALESQKSFDAFAAALRRSLPKVDRVCLTTYSDGNLRVERASYPGKGTFRVAGTGFEFHSKFFSLAFFALLDRFTALPDISKAQGFDMMLMSKTMSSSVHVPVILDGKPGTVNYWSKGADAFPADQHDMLRALAEVMVPRKS
jgi:thiol-disulfide isomerase/thioredoxin